ncbi:myb-related transcription factor, partner of profilin-like [Salarias fasciatus]|uniref:myb-related transcription factor, partner of profilin-like n=1 Tax=Salarias fasciatus TaxID=181472 RepID=UPI0011766C60|nr:myb-related transcription factor, partner of profilin-like [Salarias fasciatus]
MERRSLSKKRNFSELEIDTLTSGVEVNQEVLFGSLKTGIKTAHKKAVWKKITAAVNSVAVDQRTPSEVKKKWSDLKLATKKHVSALRRSGMRAGRGQPDASLILTAAEQKIASIIRSELDGGICAGGDTDALAPEQNEPGTSGPTATSPPQSADSPTESDPGPGPGPGPGPSRAAERGRVPPAPRAGPRPAVVPAEIPESPTEICRLLTAVVTSLQAINDTLIQINQNLKKS